jgi:hypothetical protein
MRLLKIADYFMMRADQILSISHATLVITNGKEIIGLRIRLINGSSPIEIHDWSKERVGDLIEKWKEALGFFEDKTPYRGQ